MSFLVALLPTLLSLLSEAPAFVADVEAVVALLSQKAPLTAEQQAAIDAALEAAHKALQAS